MGGRERWWGEKRRRIIILCRPLVLTQTPELSAVQRGRCEGQTFSVNWHFVSSEPSFCEGSGRESECARGKKRVGGGSGQHGGGGAERGRERDGENEREPVLVGLLGLVEGVYGSLLILC